jgi:hypothetical protein
MGPVLPTPPPRRALDDLDLFMLRRADETSAIGRRTITRTMDDCDGYLRQNKVSAGANYEIEHLKKAPSKMTKVVDTALSDDLTKPLGIVHPFGH